MARRLIAAPPTLAEEQQRWQAGYRCVAGLDEAGRGAWAGPVTAAAVVLPPDPAVAKRLRGVADSKQLSAAARERLCPLIQQEALAWAVGWASSAEIDAQGIAAATREAMLRALAALTTPPDFLLLDYVRLPECPLPQHALAHGDSLVLSIAAASILAKVVRDHHMAELAVRYPAYGFERHKGYGVLAHRCALQQHGPCIEHRLSFRPSSQAGQQAASGDVS